MTDWKERSLVYLLLAVMTVIITATHRRTTINVYDCQGQQQGETK